MRFTHLAEFSKYAKYQPFKFYLLISVIACFPITYAPGAPLLRHLHAGPRGLDRERGQDARPLEHQHDASLRQGARPDHSARDEQVARGVLITAGMETIGYRGSITIDRGRVILHRNAGGEVWLAQPEIARLFGVFEAAVRANIRAIYRSEALRRGPTQRIVHGVEFYLSLIHI